VTRISGFDTYSRVVPDLVATSTLCMFLIYINQLLTGSGRRVPIHSLFPARPTLCCFTLSMTFIIGFLFSCHPFPTLQQKSS